MRKSGWVAAALIWTVAAPQAASAADRRIAPGVAQLMARADALKAQRDEAGALEAAKAALAAADARKGDERSQFEALDHLTGFWPSGDLAGSFTLFDRLAPLAAKVDGADSYRAHAALAGRNLLAFFLGKPGATIDAIVPPLDGATRQARTDKERMDIGAIALVLAQFYSNSGQRAKGEQVAAQASKLFETPPATPIGTYAGGLTTLAQLHAGWGNWQTSLGYADRAIVEHDRFDGRRTINAAAPLIHRGNAMNALLRFEEAEAAYRTAVALTDTAPDPIIKASALHSLGRFYRSIGRDAQAESLIQRAADLAEAFPPGAGSRMAALIDLYNIAISRGDYAQALRFAKLGVADVEKRTFRNSLNHGAILLSLANAALPLGQFEEARVAIDAAAPMIEKGDRPGGSRRAELLIARGRLALRQGRAAEAVPPLQAGIAMMAALPAPDPQGIAAAQVNLAEARLALADRSGAWASGRAGAGRLTDSVLRRAGSTGGSAALGWQEQAVFDTALDVAWANRDQAGPVTTTPPAAATARTP